MNSRRKYFNRDNLEVPKCSLLITPLAGAVRRESGARWATAGQVQEANITATKKSTTICMQCCVDVDVDDRDDEQREDDKNDYSCWPLALGLLSVV